MLKLIFLVFSFISLNLGNLWANDYSATATATAPQLDLESPSPLSLKSRQQLDFYAGLGLPFLRTGNLGDLGGKSYGKSFTLSYFFPSSKNLKNLHGITLGLNMDGFGSGGKLHDDLRTFEPHEKNKLTALNFYTAYSFKQFLTNQNLSWTYDLGGGVYRFAGLGQESSNKNLWSLNQRLALSYFLPEAWQFIHKTEIHSGVSFLHTWLPQVKIRSYSVQGHNLGVLFHLRFANLF